MQVLKRNHLLNSERLHDDMPYDMHALDVKYIIAINEDAIAKTGAYLEKIEYVTLHRELMTISPDMEGKNSRDLNDFKAIVNAYGPYWDEGIFPEPSNETPKVEEPTMVSPPLPPVMPIED